MVTDIVAGKRERPGGEVWWQVAEGSVVASLKGGEVQGGESLLEGAWCSRSPGSTAEALS